MRKAALIAALLAAGPAHADTLRFFPPDGFTGAHVSDSGALKLSEYVGEGSALDGWRDAITVAELRDSGMTALDFVNALSADSATRCEQAFQMDPEVVEVDGRTSTMSIHACPNLNVSGRPELGVLRVIEGRDGTLFAVQRSWVVTPPRAELDEWSNWLRALQVCDDAGCS